MRTLILLVGIFLIQGCLASYPIITDEKIQIGMSEAEVNDYLARHSNETGQWESRLIKERLIEGKRESTYILTWVKLPGHTIYKHISKHKFTFVDGQLVSRSVVDAQPQEATMSISVGGQPRQPNYCPEVGILVPC